MPPSGAVSICVTATDGNQALVIPMSLDQKLEFYKMLLRVGFKEIEVGFPAASDTEYEFLRRLVEDDLIPDDVTVQVLTQAREHIIRKTFDALRSRASRTPSSMSTTPLRSRSASRYFASQRTRSSRWPSTARNS